MEEVDVNSVFEDIFFSETKVANQAYEDGYKKGCTDGLKEGYHLGYHRGAELGLEVGFYEGVVSCLKESQTKGSERTRVAAAAEKLETVLAKIPKENSEIHDIIHDVSEARTCFKRLMSLLKVPLTPPMPSSVQF